METESELEETYGNAIRELKRNKRCTLWVMESHKIIKRTVIIRYSKNRFSKRIFRIFLSSFYTQTDFTFAQFCYLSRLSLVNYTVNWRRRHSDIFLVNYIRRNTHTYICIIQVFVSFTLRLVSLYALHRYASRFPWQILWQQQRVYIRYYIYTNAEFPFRLLSLFSPAQYEIICLIKIQLCKF